MKWQCSTRWYGEQCKSEFSEENTEAIVSSLLCLEVSSVYSFSVNCASVCDTFYIEVDQNQHIKTSKIGDLDQVEARLASNKYTDF